MHREAGFTFHFFAGDRGHRPHVHVRGHGRFGKIWLVPRVRMEKDHVYTRPQVARILKIADAHRIAWLDAWEGFFGTT